MPEVWVVNVSPIIVLAKAGRLHLLNDLADELVVPEPVTQELLRGPPSDPARQAIEAGWAPGQTPLTIPATLLEWGLGAGETAVLALPLERSPSTAILDDAAARNCAKAANIPVLGTLGVVLRAKKRGIIPRAADALRAILAAGLFLDDRIVRMALGRIGETW